MPNNTVYLLAKRDVWQGHIPKYILPLDKVRQRMALSILTNLHSRHVGISAELAASLASALLGQHRSDYQPIWDAVLGRLHTTLISLSGQRYHDQFDDLLRFRSAMSYTVYKLVQPLIDVTCKQVMGQVVLMADDSEIEESVTVADYNKYTSALNQRLLEVIEGHHLPAIFWQDRALMLNNMGWQQRSTQDYQQLRTLNSPTTSLADTAVFLTLDPEPRTRQSRQKNIHIPQPMSMRDDRQQDAGYDGITLTTRLENLHHMLSTEYIYPQQQRIDRLFNSGFWILKPPPRSIKMRDVLIVGMAPHSALRLSSSIFVKTCWFDFSLHLASVLRSFNLNRSEFRWIQGDSLNRMHVKHLLLSHLDGMPSSAMHQHSAVHRQHYLRALEWLPDYLNEQLDYRVLKDDEPIDERMYVDDVTSWWLRQAWKHQGDSAEMRDNDRTSEAIQRSFERDVAHAASRFGFIHTILFLPRSLKASDESIRHSGKISLSKLKTLLPLKQSEMSITWIPDDILNASESNGWSYQGGAGLSKNWHTDDRVNNTKLLASDLVDVWLQDILAKMTYA